MTLRSDHVAGAAFVLFGLVVFVLSGDLPFGSLSSPGAGMMPKLLLVLMVVFGVALLFGAAASQPFAAIDWSDGKHALLIALGAGVAIYLLMRAGYVITMAALLLYLLVVVARRHWAASVLVAAALAAGTFALFDLGLRVLLPRSPFGFF